MAELTDGKIEICPFSLDAYDDAFALWRQCEGIGLSAADSRENIQRYLERNPGMSFIAMSGGVVVGAALCGHDGRRGYLHHLAVHPGYRRRFVGRRLTLDPIHELPIAELVGVSLAVINVPAIDFAMPQNACLRWQTIGRQPLEVLLAPGVAGGAIIDALFDASLLVGSEAKSDHRGGIGGMDVTL